MATSPKGTIYLIHFNRAYKHARHYLGYSEHLDKRITDHLCGMGARLMEVVTQAGIEWRVSRTWPGDRRLERHLKNRKDAPRLCPTCNPKAFNRAKERQRLSQGRGQKGMENLPYLKPEQGAARDHAAKAVGVSGKSAAA